MSDPLMDWLERNNPDMARVLHDERYFNGEAIERLQTEVERLRKNVETCRTCKVCGEDKIIAAIGARFGHRPDVMALHVQRLQAQLDAVRELSPDALILLGWMTKAAGAWTTGEMRELTGLNHPHRAAHELVAAGLIKRLPETYFKTPRMAALEQEQEQGAKLKEAGDE